jgi:hypothetical protein
MDDQEPEQELTEVSQTKQYRKDLDEVLQRLKLDSDTTRERTSRCVIRGSRERSLAITKIQEGIMWLGMDLKAQSEEARAAGGESECANPYPESYNPDSQVIEPTADGLKL